MGEPGYESIEIRLIKPVHFSWKLDHDVHVWKFPVISEGLNLLTVSEREFASRFRFQADRNRFAVGRQALRILLSKYLSVLPREVHVSGERGEKPFITSPTSNIHFNISHSGDWVLVALAVDELGIDIEKIAQDFKFEDLLQEHFNEKELDFISDASDAVRAFYYLWTRKEALTKAWGKGLRENLKRIDTLGEYSFFGLRNQTWKLDSFKISADYMAALAYSVEMNNIIYLEGSDLLNGSMERE